MSDLASSNTQATKSFSGLAADMFASLSKSGQFGGSGIFASLLTEEANTTATALQTVMNRISTSSTGNTSFSASLMDNLRQVQNLLGKMQNTLSAYRSQNSVTTTQHSSSTASSGSTRNSGTATPSASSGIPSATSVSSAGPSPTSGANNATNNSSDNGAAGSSSSTAPVSYSANSSSSSTTSVAATGAADATTSSSDSNTATTEGNLTALAALLAQLQHMLQLVVQQLQNPTVGVAASVAATTTGTSSTDDVTSAAISTTSNAQNTNSAAATTTNNTIASTTPVTLDPLAGIDDMLQRLLELSRKGLGDVNNSATASTTTATTTPADTSSTTGASADLMQIQSGLDKLVTALKDLTAPATALGTGSATIANADKNAAQNGAAWLPLTSSKGAVNTADASVTTDNGSAANQGVKLDALFAVNVSTATKLDTANAVALTAAQGGMSDVDDVLSGSNSANTPVATNASTANTTPAQTANNSGTPAAVNPYSFANQLSATRSGVGSTGLPSAVEQVLVQMHRSAKVGESEIVMQLTPADLGRITVKLDVASDGKVQGTVVADSQTTLDMLVKDSRSLERALQDAGLRADSGSLQFSLGQQQQGNGNNQTANNTNNAATDATQGVGTDSALNLSAAKDEIWVISPNRINMKV